MARSVLSDEIWVQLQVVMKSKGCRSFTNGRNVMEGILWKLRTGGPWRDIPRKSNSTKPNLEFDSSLYKLRHLVENLFARLKHFRSIATRFEKLARNYKAMVYLGCSFIWLKLGI